MKLALPGGLTRTVSRAVLRTQKHSPTILFAVGVVGMGATVVTACKATLRLEETLDKAEAERDVIEDGVRAGRISQKEYNQAQSGLYMRNVGRVAWLYAPSVALGVISIAALTKSHNILTQRNAALTAAYSAVAKALSDYRGRVQDAYGEERELELYHGTVESTKVVEDKNGPKKIKSKHSAGGSLYAKIFDETNINWDKHAEYNVMFLRGAQRWANEQLWTHGHLLLNDLYKELGMEKTPAGSQVGWIYDPKGRKKQGDGHVDLGIWDDKDMVRFKEFVLDGTGIWLDFNVDGEIWELI